MNQKLIHRLVGRPHKERYKIDRQLFRPTLEALEDRLTPSSYDLFNLGTISDNTSFGIPEDVNSNGIVVGTTYTNASSARRAFIIVPQDTNNDGKPDQWSRDDDQDGFNDLMQKLKTVSEAWSAAYGINHLGQVVGAYWSSATQVYGHAFLITPTVVDGETRWFVDENGDGTNDLMTDLGTLGGMRSVARDINNQGQVVGLAMDSDDNEYPFLWNPKDPNGDTGIMMNLGTLGGVGYSDNSHGAYSINEVGQIAGVTRNSEGQRRGFVITPQPDENGVREWRNDESTGPNTFMTDLGSLEKAEPFYGSQAFAINDGGVIVGEADSTISSMWGHAVRWDQQPEDGSYEITDLGGLHLPKYHSTANDVNSLDVIVGHSQEMSRSTWGAGWAFYEPIGPSRAFIIDGGEMQPLDELVSNLDLAGFDALITAQAISENGHIVGWGNENGEKRAFIAVPTIAAAPQLSINDVSQTEGDSGSTIFTFTVTRSGDDSVPLYVDYATFDGTATVADNDYEFAAGTLFFDAGETTQTITIIVYGDTDEESDETFTVQLSDPTNGATIADDLGEGTILDDDGSAGGNGNGKGNGKPNK